MTKKESKATSSYETAVAYKEISYNEYPGILGDFNWNKQGGRAGGNRYNLLRWTIAKLIKLNNWIETKKINRRRESK